MAGRPQICLVCGCKAWRPAKAPCIYCGGETRIDYSVDRPVKMNCLHCGKLFIPTNRRIKTCSPECSHERDLKLAREASARRYAESKSPTGAVPHSACHRPWAWLETDVENGGKRRILTTLVDQSSGGVFPWPDVLSVPERSPIDDCPFL